MKLCLSILVSILVAWASQVRLTAHSLSDTLFQTGPGELIVVNQQVWCLAKDGKITVYDVNGTKLTIPSTQNISAKHIAGDGHDVVAQIGNTIQRWTSIDAEWHVVGQLSMPVFALVVNSKKQVFAVTSKGIWNRDRNSFLLPASSPNDQTNRPSALSLPAAYFMDAQDNLWLGYGYGEWGGNIYTYNTLQGKFIDLKFNNFQINLRPIKSFFQFKSDVGVSSGLQHMSNSGTIAEFENLNAKLIYDSRKDIDTTTRENRWRSADKAPYIGPATYDAQIDYIYFYSNKGVFRGKSDTDLSKFSNWQQVFTPKLHWRKGQPDAVGSPMNVLKILSLGDGKLVLLTQNDGVGLWNGSSFKLLP